MRILHLILMLSLVSGTMWSGGCGGGPGEENPADAGQDASTDARLDSEVDSGPQCVRNEDCDSGFHCEDGTCVEDQAAVCDTSSCSGHGSCDDSTGVVQCTCDQGYGGENCSECAQGFVQWPEGVANCVDDPCAPDPCTGEHALGGSCEQTGRESFTCGCDQGFVWASDGRGCVPTLCEPDPCTRTHEVAGSCESTGPDTFSCDCETGYRWLTNLETCVTDLCNPDPCTGDHDIAGTCEQTGVESFLCACQNGCEWNGTTCEAYCRDADGDQYGEGAACLGTDCNDGDPNINPGTTERCNGVDDNCDGNIDGEGSTGCTDYYFDGDGDGWGISDRRCLCAPAAPYTADNPYDCVDDDPAINPGAAERCNGTDDNCNALVDEQGAQDCRRFYKDRDQDGWGISYDWQCLCAPHALYSTQDGGDCDDTNPDIYPDAQEVCNHVDDDCDGLTDEDPSCP